MTGVQTCALPIYLISQLIGNKTVKQQSHNKPKYLDLNPATRTIHESEIQRALLLPQEVIGLPRDEQIILIESTPPIKTKKIFYYSDPFFKRRLLDPIHVPTQEPFDPRKLEEEKQKKDAEEKKKKEEERKKKEEEQAKLRKEAEALEAASKPKATEPAAPAPVPTPVAAPINPFTDDEPTPQEQASAAPAIAPEPQTASADSGADNFSVDNFDLDFPDFPDFDDVLSDNKSAESAEAHKEDDNKTS